MKYLTQYTENAIYGQSQVVYLAFKMCTEISIAKDIELGDSITINNEVASFTFTLTERDTRDDHSAHYYKLVKITKHIEETVGASIIVDCNFEQAFSQGDIATLTRNDGPSGWWAVFPSGEWNVGFGHDFFVIKTAEHRKAEQ